MFYSIVAFCLAFAVWLIVVLILVRFLTLVLARIYLRKQWRLYSKCGDLEQLRESVTIIFPAQCMAHLGANFVAALSGFGVLYLFRCKSLALYLIFLYSFLLIVAFFITRPLMRGRTSPEGRMAEKSVFRQRLGAVLGGGIGLSLCAALILLFL